MTSLALCALMLAEAIADPCASPDGERPPDPRCGETLDGRTPAEPSTARKVGQAALAGPRLSIVVAPGSPPARMGALTGLAGVAAAERAPSPASAGWSAARRT